MEMLVTEESYEMKRAISKSSFTIIWEGKPTIWLNSWPSSKAYKS